MSAYHALSTLAENGIYNVRYALLLLTLRHAKLDRRIDMDEMSKLCFTTKSGLSKLFDAACIDGYANRVRDKHDHRFITASLTPKGIAFVRSLEAA